MRDSEKELYMLHSALPSYKRKLQASLDLLQKAKNMGGKWCVSYSTGKDSTVLLDLAYQVFGKELIVLHQSYGKTDLPGTVELFEKAKRKYPLKFIVNQAPSNLEVLEKAGGFFDKPTTKQQKEAWKWWREQGWEKADEMARDAGVTGNIVGLRAQESRARKISISVHGTFFYNKKQQMHQCRPLAYWNSRDIWAYIISNELEYHPVYDFARNEEERGRIRNELTLIRGMETLSERGLLAETRMRYPEFIEEIIQEYPELKTFL